MTALGWRPLQRLMISIFNIRLVKSESYKEKHGPEPKLARPAQPSRSRGSWPAKTSAAPECCSSSRWRREEAECKPPTDASSEGEDHGRGLGGKGKGEANDRRL